MAQLAEAAALGLLSAATPCLLPLYPAFIAFLAANASTPPGRATTALLGLAVLVGVLVTVGLVGAIVTVAALPLSVLLVILVPAVDAVVVVLGLLLVAGRNVFGRLPGISAPSGGGPIRRAFVYGLLLGPLAVPCAGPFLVALLAISLGPLDALGRLATFLAFGLGAGAPLVALSLVSAARGRTLARAIAARHAWLERLAGAILVIAGIADLAAWGPELGTWWPALLAPAG